MNVGSGLILLRQRENRYSSVQRSLFTYQAVVDILYLVSLTLLALLIIITMSLSDLHLADVQFTRALQSVRTGSVSPLDASSLPSDEHSADRRTAQPAVCVAHSGPRPQGPQGIRVCLDSLHSALSSLRCRLKHPQVPHDQNCPP